MKRYFPIREIGRQKSALIALLACLCVIALSSSAFALRFKTTHEVADVATGDMNGDGLGDIVTCGISNNRSSVDVLLGNGDGTFQKATASAVGSGPVAILLGDFNLDGNLDAATAGFGINGGRSKSISVLLGDGDGTFQPRQKFLVSDLPTSIATADLDGDGDLDLAVGESSSFVVLLGDGAGGFQLTSSVAVSDFSEGIALGDVDGDGNTDVLVGNTESVSSISLGNGDGTFRKATMSGGEVVNPTLIDVNGDGLPDLVGIVPYSPNNLSVFLNVGNVVFGFKFDLGAVSTIDDFVSGDFNDDGKVDFVVAVESPREGHPNSTLTLLGSGDGTFAVVVNSDVVGDALAAGFFNSDSELDLSSGDSSAFLVRAAYGQGNGHFSGQP